VAWTRRTVAATILEGLWELDESPWVDLYGKPIESRRLPKMLGKYGGQAQVLRIGDTTLRGYTREALADLWRRYLPASATSATRATSLASTVADVADVAHTCLVCGEQIDLAAGDVHPACERTAAAIRELVAEAAVSPRKALQ
jgi:hypothetical protein